MISVFQGRFMLKLSCRVEAKGEDGPLLGFRIKAKARHAFPSKRHLNRGDNPHTSKYQTWRIKTAIAFSDRQKAIAFEKFLKPLPAGHSRKKGSDPL